MTYSVQSTSQLVYVDAAAAAGEVSLVAADELLSHFSTPDPVIVCLQSETIRATIN